MVCAICGRMPLMMQSAPISRAAATVFSRCCATSVSTVGTPVMSMIAISAPGLDDPLEQGLHDDLRAGAVERADQRQREDAVPELHDRRRELEQLLLLARDDLLAALLKDLGRVEAELVEQFVVLHSASASALGSLSSSSLSDLNNGCFSENTKVAVSDGVSPAWRANVKSERACRGCRPSRRRRCRPKSSGSTCAEEGSETGATRPQAHLPS